MEFDLISRLLRATARQREDVVLGPGDDGAVMSVPDGQQLVTSTDTLVEGVHFLPGTAAYDIGWKALAVNLSDLAAMGASPAWALLSLTMPRADATFIDGLAAGFDALAGRHKLCLVGGDTTSGPLTIGITVMGLVPAGKALLRSSAKPGDAIMVTGSLGAGMGGLHCLAPEMLPRSGGAGGLAARSDGDRLLSAPGEAREQLVERYLRPNPRIEVGRNLRGLASACIDLSDGLLADLAHLCRASTVGAEIEAARLPRAPALMQLFGEAGSIEYALGGGDDYELCFTVPEREAGTLAADLVRAGHEVSRIGRVVAGEGVQVLGKDGRKISPRWRGWEHFGA